MKDASLRCLTKCPSSASDYCLFTLNMIDLFQVVQHIAAVKNDLALKEVLVIKDMLMLN